MSNFNEANVTRSREGKFTGHIAKEPGFSIGGMARHEPGPAPLSPEAAFRVRAQADAAASLQEAYPDVVAARFVDIGSPYLVAPNGQRMANPDYEPQPNVDPMKYRSFELRDVLLADGTVADENNPPKFTSDPSVEKIGENFQDYAAMLFDVQDDYEISGLYRDHINNQHVYFHQMIRDGAPGAVEASVPAAAQQVADMLVGKYGKESVLNAAGSFVAGEPYSQRADRLREALEDTPRSWNPFRRR